MNRGSEKQSKTKKNKLSLDTLEALRLSENKWRTLVEAIPNYIALFDLEGRYVFLNHYAKGYSAADIIGKPYGLLLSKETKTQYDQAFENIRQTGNSQVFEYSAPGDYGVSRYYNSYMVPMYENGQLSNTLVIARDITERMQAEEKLRENEQFVQSTLDALPTHICVLDENGTIISINRAWREFADANGAADPGYYLGSNYLTVCDTAQGTQSQGADTFAKGIRKVMRHEFDQFTQEYTCDSPSENRWFIANITRFKGKEGDRLVISHLNITERKRAEEGLRESRERLSRLSYHLVETQEQERRRVARELHDEIGQTLTALTINLNGFSQTILEDTGARKLENIKGLALELSQQVNALSSELRPRVLDDLGLAPGLISLFSRLTTQTGIEIDFKHGLIGPRQIAPEIEITAYRIIQEAMTNIIRHAAVKTAVVRIQIDQNTLWIQVQDEGKGFDYPLAIKSVHSMGLTSMLERAELVGGQFTIQTAPNEGTSITCRLPLGARVIERRKYGRD